MTLVVRISFVFMLTAFAVAIAIAFSPSNGKLSRFSIASPFTAQSRLFDGTSPSINKVEYDDFPNYDGDSLVPPPIIVAQEYSTKNKQNALDYGRAFAKSIMETEYESIPDSDGMSVLRNTCILETGENKDIVLRSITIPFWQKCLEKVQTSNKRYRVAAIGTPGIGKTSTTPILIRMLLKEGKTVVYLVRSLKEINWFYEFVPGPNNSIVTNVYSEKTDPFEIPSLQVETSYYIVDPGETKNSCNPPATFKPKVILVPSPDSGHWGGSEFKKTRGSVRGFFKCMPLWSLEELLSAQPFLCPEMTKEEVQVNYRTFGGVPRNVFGPEDERADALDDQDLAFNELSKEQVKKIAKGEMDAVDSFFPSAPKSNLMGYVLADKDNSTFSHRKAVLLSPLIEEKVYSKHMAWLWGTMISQGKDGWKMFEAYTRSLMTNKVQLQCRPCVGMKGNRKSLPQMLGGCTEIRIGLNPISDANAFAEVNGNEKILFHSVRRNNPLFDFAYREANGHFHVFQATVGITHSADPKLIEALQNEVCGASNLSIYYLVPGENFEKFVTDPVNPNETNKNVCCDIWHVLVPDPNAESILLSKIAD